jgi:hypothetical protein
VCNPLQSRILEILPAKRQRSRMQVTAIQQRAAVAGAFRPSRVVRGADNGAGLVSDAPRRHPVDTLLAPVPQAPVVARRAPLVCRAAAEVEEVGVSATGSQEAVAHLRYQRGSVFKVGRGGCRSTGSPLGPCVRQGTVQIANRLLVSGWPYAAARGRCSSTPAMPRRRLRRRRRRCLLLLQLYKIVVVRQDRRLGGWQGGV